METKTRSLVKTIVWRLIAILNSFTIIYLFPTQTAIYLAVGMNITGFIVFYIFERVCQRVKWGIK
jgi:uncharacterized membrane protein